MCSDFTKILRSAWETITRPERVVAADTQPPANSLGAGYPSE
jgi:hypothetical protein